MDVRYPTPPPSEGGGDAPGPPPPPFERARRRRRRRIIIAGVLVGGALVVGLPLLAFGGWLAPQDAAPEDAAPVPAEAPETDSGSGEDDADTDGSTDPDGPSPDGEVGDRPDREVPEEERIDPPSLGELEPGDARIADMLLDVDAAERAMLRYQLDAQDAFTDGLDADEPDELFAAIGDVASTGLQDLEVLRERLMAEQSEPAAEDVREAYVGHLDSWVTYLTAIEDDPQILLGDLTRFTVDINRTGDDFSRAVAALSATDVDADVERFAQQIVERGFSGPETAQV